MDVDQTKSLNKMKGGDTATAPAMTDAEFTV